MFLSPPPSLPHATREAHGTPRQTTARSGLDPASSKLLLYLLVLRRTHEMGGLPPRPSSSTWGTSSQTTRLSSTLSSPRSTKHSSDLLLDLSIMDLLGLTTAGSKTPRMSSPRKPSRRGSQRARRSVLCTTCITLVELRRWTQSSVRYFCPRGPLPQFGPFGTGLVGQSSGGCPELELECANTLDEIAIADQPPLRFLGVTDMLTFWCY